MTSTLSGKVQVSTPGAPAIRVEVAHSGTVAVSPGMVGPQGGGVRLDGAVASYADLPTDLGIEDAGAAFVTQDDGLLYVWSGTAWPPEGAGSQFRGDKGDRGTGVESISVAGDDLNFGLSDGTSRRVTVPALVAASAAAADAAGAADRAVSARSAAQLARDGAVDAAGRAEGAAAGVAADAVAAGDAAGRAEAAADAADASAAAAAADAAEVDDAREYVGIVHDSLKPGGWLNVDLSNSVDAANAASYAATDARDAAAASATAAQGHADSAWGAAAGVGQVVSDAAGVLAGEIADDVAAAQAAKSGAESARDQSVGAASQATTKADEAAASATLADSRATDAEGAVASIAAYATDAEGAAGRAAVSEIAAAGSATAAEGHADRAATEAGAAAQIAAQEKIAALVGDAPEQLDTIYELAAAFEDRGDAIAAIQDALANRVMGNHSSVISATVPGAGTPTNQVTFVVEGT